MAIGDIFGFLGQEDVARGDKEAASLYGEAANLEQQNVEAEQAATSIRTTQIKRQNYQQLGGIQSQVAGGGFALSGSAQDIMRSSQEQGSLKIQSAQTQGALTEQGYNIAATGYNAEAAQASAAGQAAQRSAFGDLANAFGSVLPFVHL